MAESTFTMRKKSLKEDENGTVERVHNRFDKLSHCKKFVFLG